MIAAACPDWCFHQVRREKTILRPTFSCLISSSFQKTHAMQKLVFFLAPLIFGLGCKKDEKPPLPPNTIQIDGQNWAYSASCGLLRTAGFGSDIYVKIDGEDGSSLYLVLPDIVIGAYSVKESTVSAGGYNVRASVEYYLSPSLNSKFHQTDALNRWGTVELIALDIQSKTLDLRFDVALKDGSQEIEIASGILQNISYDNVAAFMTYLDASAEKNQVDWQISEYGADMYGGKVGWFFYNNTEDPRGQIINFNIPWCAKTGVYQLTPADGNLIFFPEHSPLFSWKLKSGQMQLEEVDFCVGRMRGKFQAIFETFDNAVPPIEFNDVQFEVRYDFR